MGNGEWWGIIGVQFGIAVTCIKCVWALADRVSELKSRVSVLEEAVKNNEKHDETQDIRADKHSVEFKKIYRGIDQRVADAVRRQMGFRVHREEPPQQPPRLSGDAS